MKKAKKFLLLGGIALLVITAVLGIYFGVINRQSSTTEGVASKLYWNADRDDYIPELGGDTIRKPGEDGRLIF